MNRTKLRSIRVAVDEGELALAHKLAHVREQSLSDMLRALVKEDAARRSVVVTKVKR